MSKKVRLSVFVFSLLIVVFLGGCVTVDQFVRNEETVYYRPAKTVSDYEKAGEWWGRRHWGDKNILRLQPGQIDGAFVEELVNEKVLDYFWVHSDLKDAFVKGYRIGYQDRIADLVLGPNITKAAERIGNITGKQFVKVIEDFEEGWARTLKRAIDVFITLISEGSQSDREKFIKEFVQVYNTKFEATQRMLREGGVMTQKAEGGTLLFIDYSKGKTLGALDIPPTNVLKKEIYHQTFKVMGDELGRRFSTNLIKRNDLVDLLRRSKTALEEVEPGLEGNMGIIQAAFIKSYGTDADNVFRGLIKDAGYTISPRSVDLPTPGGKKK